jgi:DNA modification methylase
MKPLVVRLSDSVEIWHADCRDVLPVECDAVVTDPPYGIAKARHRTNTGGKMSAGGAAPKRMFCNEFDEWDSETLSADDVALVLRSAPIAVVWGGNYMADKLPPSMGWLFWDKLNDGKTFSHGELAWTTRNGALRVKRHRWDGMLRDGDNADIVHPTQKPIEIMAWCMAETRIAEGATVLDPYMGSGTTGIACIRTGRKFIGIEIDAGHFATARARLENELRQGLLPLTHNDPLTRGIPSRPAGVGKETP